MESDPKDVARIMGGYETLKQKVMTLGELRRAVEYGLPVEALDSVVTYVADQDERAASELRYRIVPKSTLKRRHRLNAEESQRLERLARITSLAEQVWEDRALAHEFLNSAQPQLGGERPVDLARTDLGAREVEELLFRIEHALPI